MVFTCFFSDVPEMPGKPQAGAITHANLKLTWAAPRKDGGSPITKYLVQKKGAKDATWVTVNSAVPTVSYFVEDLEPESNYSFRVFAENDVGQGPASQEVAAKTNGTKYCAFFLVLHFFCCFRIVG